MAGRRKGQKLPKKIGAVSKLTPRQFTQALKENLLSPRQIVSYQLKTRKFLSQQHKAIIAGHKRHERALKAQETNAREAVQKFKPSKSDFGKIIFVGTHGGHAEKRKRKGYPVYVTETGKKRLIRQKSDEPFKARQLKEVQLKGSKNLRHRKEDFELSRLELTAKGRASVKKAGRVETGGAYDFSKAIKPIARSLQKAIEGQRSNRSFLVSVNALMRDSKGTFTISFDVPIDKADHISIRLGGLENFVRLKLYAFLAQQLAYAGYITAGSANHIRKALGMAAGEQVTEEQWEEYHQGEGRSFSWQAPRFEVARIQELEWKIQQAK